MKSLKTIFITLILTTAFILPLQGESGFDIESRVFIPREYYVGDLVELQIDIIFEEVDILVPEKETYPSHAWISIKEINFLPTRTNRGKIKVFFKCFKPGKHILPPIPLGSITLEGVEINTKSILGDEKKIKPRRPQIELPGTRLKINIIILSFVLLPLLAIFLFHRILKLMEQRRLTKQREMPRAKLKRILKRLKRNVGKIETLHFYIKMTESIKEYLSYWLTIPAQSSTTREIKRHIENKVEDPFTREKLLPFTGVLFHGDYIKFSNHESEEEEKLSLIKKIIAMVDHLEEENENVES